MNQPVEAFGRTIQLFLVDGTPNGLTIASIHGWTGSVLVAAQSTFAKLLARPEVDRKRSVSYAACALGQLLAQFHGSTSAM